MSGLFSTLIRWPAWALGAAVLLALALCWWTLAATNAAYVASGHPLSHALGQLQFSGAALKSIYGAMQDAGTLAQYRVSQAWDFGFMASYAVFGFLLGALIARFAQPESRADRFAAAAAFSVVLAAGFDALENVVSLVLLIWPTTFPDWLALVYSGLAAIKFVLLAAGVFSLGRALVALRRGT